MRLLAAAVVILLASAAAPAPARAGARSAIESMMVNRARETGQLDETQTQKLRSAVALYKANVERLRETYRGLMRTLDGQLKAKAPDAEIAATLEKVEAAYRAITAERHKLVEDTAAYLTPVQRAKIVLDLSGRNFKRTP